MSQYYYGRETSGEGEIRALNTLRNNPTLRKKYIKLGNAINIGTIILLGTFLLGVVALTIWMITWTFQDGFNIWAIVLNPVFIIFAIVFLGVNAGKN